jgi:hypothetical protein
VVDLIEACLDVGIEHPVGSPVGRHPDRFERLVGGTLGPEPKALRGEIGLEDWLEDDLGRRHDDTVGHGWDAERPGLPRLARFWDVDPPQRLRAIRLSQKLPPSLIDVMVTPSTPGAPWFFATSTQARHKTSLRATLS